MAYIGNGRTLLVLGSNVRDDIAPNGSATYNLSQEVPGGYEGNVYVFKRKYITETLVENSQAGIVVTVSGTSVTLSITADTSTKASVAASLASIQERLKKYQDNDHTITISNSSITANNGKFTITDCVFNGTTLTLSCTGTAQAGTMNNCTINYGYSNFWEILQPENDYTIGGDGVNLNKQITFTELPNIDDKIYVIHKGEATYNLVPSDNSVGPKQLSQNLRNFVCDTFTGNGGTTFTLSQDAVSHASLLVTVAGTVQDGETFSGSVSATKDYALNLGVSPNTIIFRQAPTVGQKIRVLHLGFSTVSRRAVLSPGQTSGVNPDTIGSLELKNNAVVSQKIADSAVTTSKISNDSITSEKILLTNNTALRALRSDGTTVTPIVSLDSTNSTIINSVGTASISFSGTKSLNVSPTGVSPETTDAVSIGTSSKKFSDAHFSGAVNSNSVSTGTVSATGNITVGGTVDGVDISTFKTSVDSSIAQLNSLVEALIPIGTIIPYSGDVVASTSATPLINDRWLFCDGGNVSRAQYPELSAFYGSMTPQYPFGVGNGSTTFTLPDLRRRVVVGRRESDTFTNDGLTLNDRALDHTHTVPAHNHSLPDHSHTLPAHFHGMGTGADLRITSSGTHPTTIDIQHGHTASSRANTAALATDGGSANVTFNDPGHGHGQTGLMSGNADHSHTGTTDNNLGEHSHNVNRSNRDTFTYNSTETALRVRGQNNNTHNHDDGSGNASFAVSSAGESGGNQQGGGQWDLSIAGVNLSHGHSFGTSNANLNHTHTVNSAGTNCSISQTTHTHTIPSHTHIIDVVSLGSDLRNDSNIAAGNHTHASSSFAGSIGLVTGGVNGNASYTSGSAGAGVTGNSAVLTSGTTRNAPYILLNYIIRAK